MNEVYKKNLQQLNALVFVTFMQDTMVEPLESEVLKEHGFVITL